MVEDRIGRDWSADIIISFCPQYLNLVNVNVVVLVDVRFTSR